MAISDRNGDVAVEPEQAEHVADGQRPRSRPPARPAEARGCGGRGPGRRADRTGSRGTPPAAREEGRPDGRLEPPEEPLRPVARPGKAAAEAASNAPGVGDDVERPVGQVDAVARASGPPRSRRPSDARAGRRSARPGPGPSGPWRRRRTCTGPGRSSRRSRRAWCGPPAGRRRSPRRCASAAVASPPIPPPTTTRSYTHRPRPGRSPRASGSPIAGRPIRISVDAGDRRRPRSSGLVD